MGIAIRYYQADHSSMKDDTPPPPANAAQMASPSFKVAALDQDFLLSEPMRGVRFMLEYSKAEMLLRRARIMSTIVVFGSARFREGGAGKADYWYKQARNFGRLASQRGGALCIDGNGDHYNVIATGGGPGLMEAACRGARDIGAPAIGFNITLPHEQEPNAYTTPELTFNFHYFAIRKMHFLMRAQAICVFPGGFGTLDEMFEVLTLVQTGKCRRRPILLFGREFWSRLIDFDLLVDTGMINPGDVNLFHYVETAEEAWALLEREYGFDEAVTQTGDLAVDI